LLVRGIGMFTVLLGLSGALTYGFADFLGGLSARRSRPLAVTSLTATVGIAPLLLGLVLLGGRFTPGALIWGAVAGVSGSVGVLLFELDPVGWAVEVVF
jgi:hypothetical protein